jgi:hypothetical protein
VLPYYAGIADRERKKGRNAFEALMAMQAASLCFGEVAFPEIFRKNITA